MLMSWKSFLAKFVSTLIAWRGHIEALHSPVMKNVAVLQNFAGLFPVCSHFQPYLKAVVSQQPSVLSVCLCVFVCSSRT